MENTSTEREKGQFQSVEVSDSDLIRETTEGRKDSFERLFKKYSAMCLYYFTRNRNLPPETAKDLTQEVFLKIYRSLHQFQIGTSFKAWLMTITRNTAHDHFRKRSESSGAIMVDPTDEKALDAEKNVINKTLVRKALAVLPEKQREVVEMRYFWDMDSPEISRELGIPEGTVRSHLRQARLRLLEILEEVNGHE